MQLIAHLGAAIGASATIGIDAIRTCVGTAIGTLFDILRASAMRATLCRIVLVFHVGIALCGTILCIVTRIVRSLAVLIACIVRSLAVLIV